MIKFASFLFFIGKRTDQADGLYVFLYRQVHFTVSLADLPEVQHGFFLKLN